MNIKLLIMSMCCAGSLYGMNDKKKLSQIYESHPHKQILLGFFKQGISDVKEVKNIEMFGCVNKTLADDLFRNYDQRKQKKKQKKIVRFYNRFKNFDMQGLAIPDAPSFKQYSKWVHHKQRETTLSALEDANKSLLIRLYNTKVLDHYAVKEWCKKAVNEGVQASKECYALGIVGKFFGARDACKDKYDGYKKILNFFIIKRVVKIRDFNVHDLLMMACTLDDELLTEILLDNNVSIVWEDSFFDGDVKDKNLYALELARYFKSRNVERLLKEFIIKKKESPCFPHGSPKIFKKIINYHIKMRGLQDDV